MFFWLLHFVIPIFYYSTFGFFYIYGAVDNLASLHKAFLINTFTIFIAIFFLILAPDKKYKIEPVFENINFLFYFYCVFLVIYFLASGGYQNILAGKNSGFFLSYVNKIFDVTMMLTLLLFYQKKNINFFYPVITFTLVTTFTGSRSALISVIILTIIFLPLFKNFDFLKNQTKKFITVLLIISPILFWIATLIRGADLIPSDLPKLIIGRLSMLETSLIPIDCKDNGGALCQLDIFYDKYNIQAQFIQIINSLSPLNIGQRDVFPSQYYRSAFLGRNNDDILTSYMSINMTLPTFFYMFTNALTSCLLSASVIVAYYLLLIRYYNNIYLFSPLLISSYTLLYYFDFVMVFSQIYLGVLATIFVCIYSFFTKKLINLKRELRPHRN